MVAANTYTRERKTKVHMARIFFSMAITQAKDLALNEPSSSAVRLCPYMTPVQENEIKRRLWWSCFVIDMKSSSAAKRPCSIAYSMCRTPLPQPDATLETPSLRLTPEDEHSQIIAITSNAFVTPQFPLQGEQAHMLSLLRLFRRIHEFHLDWELSLSKTPEELGRRQMLISQLDQSLMNWFECLPPNFKNFTNAHFEASRSVPTMPWAALFLHLLYQTCVVVLHKDLVKKLGHLIKQKKSLAVAVSESGVMTCLLSLQSVTSLLHMTLSVNPELLYIPAYAGYCTHQTGLIHLDVIKEAPGTSLSIQHVSYLDIHIEALEALGKFWITPGSRMAESLSEHRQKLQTTPISTTFP